MFVNPCGDWRFWKFCMNRALEPAGTNFVLSTTLDTPACSEFKSVLSLARLPQDLSVASRTGVASRRPHGPRSRR